MTGNQYLSILGTDRHVDITIHVLRQRCTTGPQLVSTSVSTGETDRQYSSTNTVYRCDTELNGSEPLANDH